VNFAQKMYARLKFLERFVELKTEAFESFFHDLMTAAHDDFVDVRTHGNLGDQGSDGLSLHSNKLYACYAPRTFDVNKVRTKFNGDLSSALRQRPGQFTTFVFVHNDAHGVHPELATLLASARQEHPGLRFETLGARGLWQKMLPLPRHAVEDLLGCEIPVEEQVYGVGLEELAPLLERLKDRSESADPLMSLAEVSEAKLDYNGLSGEAREKLVRGMRDTYRVAEYYAGVQNPREEDEVAAGFTAHYLAAREQVEDPEDILFDLQQYVHGNRLHHPREMRAGWVVLAHFFERCHIFERPPADWAPTGTGGE
jgi:hypothetical protein